MATIKSYTDLEQSKKLAEFLLLESADMYFEPSGGFCTEPSEVRVGDIKYAHPRSVPCWSLAALLEVLTYCPDLSNHTDGKWYITTYPNDVHTCLMAYDNPVDACVEMIVKLHEEKKLL